MRVRMLRLMCSPVHGNHQPGSELDLPDDEALRRIAAGTCEPMDTPAPAPDPDTTKDPEDPPTDPPKALESMTIDQLRAYAADNDVDLGSLKKKAEILEAIRAAETGG